MKKMNDEDPELPQPRNPKAWKKIWDMTKPSQRLDVQKKTEDKTRDGNRKFI